MNKDIMTRLGFGPEVDNFEKGLCVFCSVKVNQESFKDELSLKEYHISGMCQACQDKTFGSASCEDGYDYDTDNDNYNCGHNHDEDDIDDGDDCE